MAYGDIQAALAKKGGGKRKPPPSAMATQEGDANLPDDDDESADATVTVEGNDDTADMSSYDDVEDDALNEAFDAFKSGDREAFKAAFRDAVEACVGRQTKSE